MASVAAAGVIVRIAAAGLGPENVVVVVNGDSGASLLVAGEYARLRDIPRWNIIVLHGLSTTQSTDVDHFRNEILVPVLLAMKDRGIADHIDCIAYSVDVPYSVRVATDIGKTPVPQVFTPVASINCLTFLCERVIQRNIDYLRLDANRYARRRVGLSKVQAAAGFLHSTSWNESGQPAAWGEHYYLSTVLGVTSGRGNSLQEVLSSLRRSKKADFSSPKGTIYFEKNGDVRSKTREWGFEAAADELHHLGVKAVVESGTLPQRRPDVAGAMIGAAVFDWQRCGSTILPGAICEHLTSNGGQLQKGAAQTPCTDFIRYGASGTSGAVYEPYAVQEKFPTPFIHVEYASGFTLAESFYLSVSGPYQLLIIGDPLCRPWAKNVKVIVDTTGFGRPIRGTVTLRPRVSPAIPIARYELYVDGRRTLQTREPKVAFNASALKPGGHRLSVVAVAAGAQASCYRLALPFRVAGSH